MAAPAFGTIGTRFAATGSAPAVAVPASVASGDIITVVLWTDLAATTITVLPSGFAHAQNSPESVTGTGPHGLHVVWKRASGADSGTYGFTLSASVFCYARAVRYTSCVAAGDPWDSPTSVADSSPSSVTTSPAVSVTTLDSDRLLVHAATTVNGDVGTWGAAAGFTEREGGASASNFHVSDKAQAVAGGSGTVQATTTAGAAAMAGWLGALIGTTPGGPPPEGPHNSDALSFMGKSYY